MVRHGHHRKRRAGRIGKTKLKNKNYKRWNPNPTFGDTTVKAQWDKERTPIQNLERMGLDAMPNNSSNKTKNQSNKDSIIELFDVPDSDKPSRREVYPLKQEEEEYIAKCMARWGDNYAKMFRDLKVNDMQYTEEKLKKMGARYLLLTEEQRRVDVPDKVVALLPSKHQ